ncbi:hypothetical protein SprV_0100315800 [Sparganum proliferum]
MSPRVLADKEDKTALQGHFEELSETAVDQPGDLGGPRPEQTDMEKRRRAQPSTKQIASLSPSQNGGLQVTSASTPQCQRSAASNIPTVSTNVLGTNRSRRTSSDPIRQQPDSIYSHSLLPKTPRRWPPCHRRTHSLPRPHQSPASPALPQPLRRPAPPTPRHHSLPPPVGRRPTSHRLLQSPLAPPPPTMWIPYISVPTAMAHSPHTSASSVTCESISQRLANQCLEHPPQLFSLHAHVLSPHGPTGLHAHSLKPAVDDRRLYHAIVPSLTSTSTTQQHPPSQALNCHLPRK